MPLVLRWMTGWVTGWVTGSVGVGVCVFSWTSTSCVVFSFSSSSLSVTYIACFNCLYLPFSFVFFECSFSISVTNEYRFELVGADEVWKIIFV